MQNAQANADGDLLVHIGVHDVAIRVIHGTAVLLIDRIGYLLSSQVRHIQGFTQHQLIVNGVHLHSSRPLHTPVHQTQCQKCVFCCQHNWCGECVCAQCV